MSQSSERVMYVPPKSMGFGHKARARTARVAWEKTRHFLEGHTVFELREEIEFVCPLPGDGLDEKVSAEYVSYVRSVLGPETGKPPYPSWSLSRDRFAKCLEVALNEDRWPLQRYGPAHFHFCYDLVWRKEGVQKIPRESALAGLPKFSWLGVSIGSGKVFLQPSFFFPFRHDDPELQDFLRTISADIPFSFSPNHFQRVFAAKQGPSYNSRKLPKDWLQSNKPLQPIARANARSG